MNSIENAFMMAGLSWTASKLLPFFIAFLIGFFVWWLFKKRIPNKWLKVVFLIAFCAIPFFAYFMYSPIYQGDFSSDFTTKNMVNELKLAKKNTLFVITIPNCPYCYESVLMSNQLKKRNPKLEIVYLVLSSDPKAIMAYQEIADPSIRFQLGQDLEQLTELAEGGFPSFVQRNNNQLMMWSNNQMGPATLDKIENSVEN